MANRIRGNVYILDSGSINLSWPNKANVTGFAFYATDTTSVINITLVTDSADSVFAAANPNNTPVLTGISFGKPVEFGSQLRVHVLTAGTGYIYLV